MNQIKELDYKAVKITVEGELQILDCEEPLFEWIREQVGGYVEVTGSESLEEGQVIFLDEDGIYKGYKVNEKGSDLFGDGRLFRGDIIIAKIIHSEEGQDFGPMTLKEAENLVNFK